MTAEETTQDTLAESALNAMNSGLTVGRVGLLAGAAALATAFARSQDAAGRTRNLAKDLAQVAARPVRTSAGPRRPQIRRLSLAAQPALPPPRPGLPGHRKCDHRRRRYR